MAPHSTAYVEFADIVLNDPDPRALLGAMQVAFRKNDDLLDHDGEIPDHLMLAKWYADAADAYQDLTDPREGETT